MPPVQQQQPYQPGQVIQPQQQPTAPTYDFTQQQQPQAQAPAQQPVQPTFDPNAFKQEVIDGVKQALQPQQPTAQPQQPVQQQPQEPQYFSDKYDDWGAVEKDTKKLVQDVIKNELSTITQNSEEAKRAAEEQDQKNQQQIDATLNGLRGAGYLPAVTNPFDNNDLGKQAENELIGYAVSLGSTDLAAVAKELKHRHDTGFKYDYQSKQFVQVSNPNTQEGPSMFGSLPATPDAPIQNTPPMMQQPYPQPMYPQPYGPQNPYMRPQYPAGFNAPVSTGGSYMGVGMQGQVPNAGTLRHNSYDQLVDMFNRTQ